MAVDTRRLRDRAEAGRLLAERLRRYAGREDVVVLGLPRGGVPVAFEIAQALNAPLDVFLVRKLGVPGREELALGAIATGGTRVLNRSVIESLGLPAEWIEAIDAKERRELDRRERAYRGDQPPPELGGRTVILVDDGLATGSTMWAAVQAVKLDDPARVVVAVPVADPDVCEGLRAEADEVICLMTPQPLQAVGAWYEDFFQTSDDEVRELAEAGGALAGRALSWPGQPGGKERRGESLRAMNHLERLHEAGVSIWLDTLSRELVDGGGFATMIADCAVTGATSNPTIFAKAITGSDRYDDQLRAAVAAGVRAPQELFFQLALDDVRGAAGLLRPAYEASDGRDGFVSFECTPDLADDTAATIEQAVGLWNRLALPNVMIKVPATGAGIPAIEELTARGLNINVTLLFSISRYEQVIGAYVAGLERRVAAGQSIDSIASVASFFVSRVDTKADPLLPADSDLRGRLAIANAHRAYARYRDRFADARWLALRDAGAHPQRPLWASTGTKDPAYSDVLYVEELIAPGVINTMPEATLRAFADHGDVRGTSSIDPGAADDVLRRAEEAGIDLPAITAELEREGVRSFCDSYEELLACVEAKAQRVAAA